MERPTSNFSQDSLADVVNRVTDNSMMHCCGWRIQDRGLFVLEASVRSMILEDVHETQSVTYHGAHSHWAEGHGSCYGITWPKLYLGRSPHDTKETKMGAVSRAFIHCCGFLILYFGVCCESLHSYIVVICILLIIVNREDINSLALSASRMAI